MLFLFPAYERDRAAQFLRASVAADRRYLGELAAAWRTPAARASRSASGRILANARRAAGLAHNDTEESLDRLLTETWPRRRPFAHFASSFVTYLRRFAQGVTTLTALDGEGEWKQSPAVQSRLALLDERLRWLEQRLDQPAAASSAAWPAHSASPAAIPASAHPGERQLERLERQTGVLYRQLLSLHTHGWLPTALPKSPQINEEPSS
jgi:hypothetical protein